MNRWFIAILISTFGLSAFVAPAVASDRATVTATLYHSAYEWNHGDLDAFMQTYERSAQTVYVSAKGAIHGYAAIRAHYATHYGKSMGTLSFSDLDVRSLGHDYALALAHWHLAMTNGTHPTGVFTLLFHRTPEGWRIIEDCTP